MKHYTNPDFVRLIDAVESSGGFYPMEDCMAHEIDDLVSKIAPRPPMSTGCEEAALFDVAYDPAQPVEVNEVILVLDDSPDAPEGRHKADKDEEGNVRWKIVERPGENVPDDIRYTARVCANDDLMRLWPRFRHAIRDRDPITGQR
jgi:hypothetical protein